jgi:hypothetical protein
MSNQIEFTGNTAGAMYEVKFAGADGKPMSMYIPKAMLKQYGLKVPSKAQLAKLKAGK